MQIASSCCPQPTRYCRQLSWCARGGAVQPDRGGRSESALAGHRARRQLGQRAHRAAGCLGRLHGQLPGPRDAASQGRRDPAPAARLRGGVRLPSEGEFGLSLAASTIARSPNAR
jgi:hypothetical protein